jgi:SEC-C motif domain protein
MEDLCSCGSGRSYAQCCHPFICGTSSPVTAEELMRARYSAYARHEIEYILKTTHPDKRKECDEKAIRSWSENSQWEKLEIQSVSKGTAQDTEGTVEFIAEFVESRTKKNLHENAQFKKIDGEWLYYDSDIKPQKPFIRTEIKVSRNDPCPCGSGKKFKKCCSPA